MVKLSAIIPTRDRPAPLRDCLATLQRQGIDPARLEVVVVDDGGEIDLRGVASAAAGGGRAPVRYERQDPGGLNSARNHGAEIASGDVLAFLDDDTLVSPGWAAAMLRAFEDDECSAVGGRVELKLEAEAPAWLAAKRSYLAEFQLGPEPRWLDGALVPVGANCAVRRSVFEATSGFWPGLDRAGTSLVSNGDTEFFRRLRKSGHRLRYEPAAHVLHCIPPERLTLAYFLRRARAQGVSDELLLMVQGGQPSWRRRMREVVRAGRAAPILMRNLALGRGTVNTRLWLSYCGGRLAAIGADPAAVPHLAPGATSAAKAVAGRR